MSNFSKPRTIGALLGLALVGGLLGALAGAMTVAVGLFAIEVRHGHLIWPFTAFGTLFGCLVGGCFGAVLTPSVVFTPWRYVPIGRLFAYLTIGTMLGGGASALILAEPNAAVLGGLAGFFIAGHRVSVRSGMIATGRAKPEPHAPAG